MALSPHNAALAILCRPNGTLIEVVYDELGLTASLAPGTDFAAIIAASSVGKASRFLRTSLASHVTLDWEMDVVLPYGVAPLFFSACVTKRRIVMIVTKQALADAAIPKNLTRIAADAPNILAPALKELGVRKASKAKSERSLRNQLSRLNNALAASQRETVHKETLKKAVPTETQLLEIAAHDLRNPISGILAASQYLIEDAARLLEEHHLTLLRSIESSSGLMLRLIEDMLEIPAIDSGKLRMHFQSTDLTWLVEQSAAINRPLAESKRIRLEVTTDGPVPCLDLDPLKMTQAINGLLTNAIQSSQPGSKIEVQVAARADDAMITVRDEVPGISADDLKSLLDPFRKVRSKRGLKEARTAVTLANVKRIVEGHHGEVRVESDVVKGSTFALRLPLSSRAASSEGNGGRRKNKKPLPAG
jgi:signal transduction histidine kinase